MRYAIRFLTFGTEHFLGTDNYDTALIAASALSRENADTPVRIFKGAELDVTYINGMRHYD